MTGIKSDSKILPTFVDELGLDTNEFNKIIGLLGRDPTTTELGVFSLLEAPLFM